MKYHKTHHNIFDGKSSIVVLQEIILCINDFKNVRNWRDRLCFWLDNVQIHIAPIKYRRKVMLYRIQNNLMSYRNEIF